MKFIEALAQILRTENGDCTRNAFYLYSRLSDLCTSYEDRRKVRLFFELDKRLHIIETMQEDGKISVPVLKAAYPAVKEMLPAESYKRLIDGIASEIFPPLAKERAVPQIRKQTASKTAAQKAPVQKVAAQKAPVQKTSQQKAPVQAVLPPPQPRGTDRFPILLIVALVVALAVIAGVVCLIVFRNFVSWTGWQFVIGGGGGLVLFGVWAFVAYLIDDGFLAEAYKTTLFFILFVTVVNSVLFLVFRANYKIIFIFLSVYALLAAGISSYLAFDDIEAGWGSGHIIQAVVVAAVFILGLIFL